MLGPSVDGGDNATSPPSIAYEIDAESDQPITSQASVANEMK